MTVLNPALYTAYTAQQVRDAEAPLLDAQTEPDELMQVAAARVADVAGAMLSQCQSASGDVLLLVGPGGNGGDALYAGANLADSTTVNESRQRVLAYLVRGTAHESALSAFTAAGGEVVSELPDPQHLRLVVDGVAGLGAGRPLSTELAGFLADVSLRQVPVLSIDVPSGVAADTGAVPEADGLPLHVRASVTVTFGGFRIAHVVARAECGQVVLVDIGLSGHDRPLSAYLAEALPARSFDFSGVPNLLS